MSVVGNQQRILLELLASLRPHWEREAGLPERIERLLRSDRRRGARDRRFFRELIYTALRYLPWIEPILESDPTKGATVIAWLAAETPDTRVHRAQAVGTWPACPEGVPARAAALEGVLSVEALPSLLPEWFRAECPEAFAGVNYDALARRAPLWLRLQTDDRSEVFSEFEGRGWTLKPSGLLPSAVEVLTAADVTTTESYEAGLFDIQDLGSQLILEAHGIQPGGHWLDACAGAGGKSLQLAGLLGPGGRIDAHDTRPQALEQLAIRADRAGLGTRIARPRFLASSYDGVLVDAPCSGTGTWRRSPHLKWSTTPGFVSSKARLQNALLDQFCERVRPGGWLIYATCSLCRSENEGVAEAFLLRHPEFKGAPIAKAFTGEPRGEGLLFWPAGHDGDGFFTASFVRTA